MSYQTVVIPEELAHRLRQVFHLNKLPHTLGHLAVPAETDLGPFRGCHRERAIKTERQG
jgi:hypothetical protein